MKRGPKSLLTSALEKRICDLLANANTIQTAAAACGIGERTYHDWVQNNPAFAAATRKARALAKIKLVNIIRNAAKKNAFHAQWLLERSWPSEYARVERHIEPEPADEKKNVGVTILYDTGGLGMEKLLTFPIHPSMMQRDSEVEQAKENATETDDEAPEPISEAPSKVVDNV